MNLDNISIIKHPIHGHGLAAVVPMSDWEGIVNRLDLLDALEAGGVDNWEGYASALEEWNDDA